MSTKTRNVEAWLPMFGMSRAFFDYIFNSPLCVHFDYILITVSKTRQDDESRIERALCLEVRGKKGKQINKHKKLNQNKLFIRNFGIVSESVIHLFMLMFVCVCFWLIRFVEEQQSLQSSLRRLCQHSLTFTPDVFIYFFPHLVCSESHVCNFTKSKDTQNDRNIKHFWLHHSQKQSLKDCNIRSAFLTLIFVCISTLPHDWFIG